MNEMSGMPVSGWYRSTCVGGALTITEECFERMKTDPEWEKTVLGMVRKMYSCTGIMGSKMIGCVAAGALPDPNSKEPIAVVRNEKWYQGRKGISDNKYFEKGYDKEKESALVGHSREFVNKNGYFPHIFVPVDRTHVKKHIARCLLTGCGEQTRKNSMVVLEVLPMKDKAGQDIRFRIGRTAIENIRRLIKNEMFRKEKYIEKGENDERI